MSLKTKCAVCDNDAFEPKYAGLIKCQNCNFITADVTIGEEELRALYGPMYYAGNEYSDYIGDKKITQKNFRRWLRTVRSHVSEGSLVEVGCAHGFFLELAQGNFNAIGYDVSEDAVQYANDVLGVSARNTDFLTDEDLAADSFDAIVMWDVIEHLSKPDAFIERAIQLLRPGGFLFLTTGDIESRLARIQGAGWRMIEIPAHLQYFSGKTIRQMLSGKGFNVVRIEYPGYWRSVGQIIHGLSAKASPGLRLNLYRYLGRLIPKKLGVWLNTFDIMLVVAQKQE